MIRDTNSTLLDDQEFLRLPAAFVRTISTVEVCLHVLLVVWLGVEKIYEYRSLDRESATFDMSLARIAERRSLTQAQYMANSFPPDRLTWEDKEHDTKVTLQLNSHTSVRVQNDHGDDIASIKENRITTHFGSGVVFHNRVVFEGPVVFEKGFTDKSHDDKASSELD